jgi:myo-inositol-1(or 4)-monophosphatase
VPPPHTICDTLSTKITDKALEADWLGVCRRSVERLRDVFTEYPSTGERQVRIGKGAGGDQTLVIDHGAEDVVLTELERLHAEGFEFTAISEERGILPYGSGESAVRVVIDPIDGSLNAKRLLPTFALSIAVASGDSMEDVEFGFVHEFGTGEEFVARRDGGATVNDRPLALDGSNGSGLEIVGLEAARPEWLLPVIEELVAKVHRVRIIGTIAASLCYLAASRFDGLATANVCRSVDAAAGQLIVREAGGYVSFLGYGGVEAPLDLDARYRLVAGRSPEALDLLARALTEAGVPAD